MSDLVTLDVYRYSDNGNSTLSLLFVNGAFFCHSLEDEHRDEKVKGETRIPAGTYMLGVQENATPLTKRYRSKYDWFENHLHVKDVPNFESIYIHIGNDEKTTDGCLVVADSANNNTITKGFIGSSTPAFKRLYEEIYPKIKIKPGVIRYHDECGFTGVFRG